MHPFLVLGTLTILVSGGDPTTEARLRDSLQRVPECLRGAMDDGDVRVIPGSLNAVYGTEIAGPSVEEVLRSGSGSAKSRPQRVEHYIGFTERLLAQAERLADEAAMEPAVCALPGELEPFFGDVDRIMLHEVAHAFHYDTRGGGNRIEVEEFLDIRWRDAYAAWAEDPDRIRIHEEYHAAQQVVLERAAAGKEPTSAELEQVCALQKELMAKYGRMPSRLPGDFHAFAQVNGTEYFAMAIETLAYAPEVFCKSYSAEEIAWLKDVLGQCLANLKKRAACYDAMPAADDHSTGKAGAAGILRD